MAYHHGCVSLTVLIDLSAAFAITDNNIILFENAVGVKGTVLSWLRFYLTNCYQFVDVNGDQAY